MNDKITLEDINTWITLFDFDIPIELDLSESGDFELFTWTDNNILTPKFNHDNTYYTSADDPVVFNNDGSLTLDNYNRVNPFYMFPSITAGTGEGKKFYFNPVNNINRLLFGNDDLTNRKCYINYLGNEQLEINGNAPVKDDVGWYVPLNIVLDNEISCGVSGAKTFTPKINYIYSLPKIDVIGELYIGNNNSIKDKLSLPANVDYIVYHNNKPVDNIYIPKDVELTKMNLKVVTKSNYPYIPSEQYIEMPVNYKRWSYVNDLENYQYMILTKNHRIIEDVIINKDLTVYSDNDDALSSHTSDSGHIIVSENATATFEGVDIKSVPIINKGVLIFDDCDLSGNYKPLLIINEGRLIIKHHCLLSNRVNIINKGELVLNDNRCKIYHTDNDLPVIHNTGSMQIINNHIISTGSDYTGFDICFVRSNDLNVEQLLYDNDFSYHSKLTVDGVMYNVQGRGFAYANLDDDTLHFINVEVENV